MWAKDLWSPYYQFIIIENFIVDRKMCTPIQVNGIGDCYLYGKPYTRWLPQWASSTGLTAVSKFKPRLPAQWAVGTHRKGPSRMEKSNYQNELTNQKYVWNSKLN